MGSFSSSSSPPGRAERERPEGPAGPPLVPPEELPLGTCGQGAHICSVDRDRTLLSGQHRWKLSDLPDGSWVTMGPPSATQHWAPPPRQAGCVHTHACAHTSHTRTHVHTCALTRAQPHAADTLTPTLTASATTHVCAHTRTHTHTLSCPSCPRFVSRWAACRLLQFYSFILNA